MATEPATEAVFILARVWYLLFPPDIVELKVEPLQTGREALTAESERVQKPEAGELTTETSRRPPALGR